MSHHLWWYLARSSGIVAWVMVAASVVWGLLLSTKLFGRSVRANWLLDLHRFLGGAAVVFVGIHMTGLFLDSYSHFGPTELLVPLASRWHPLAVAWGVIGLYLLAAVEITSLLRRRLSPRAWRLTHFLSFPLFVVSTAHGLSVGSERGNVVLAVAMWSTSAGVLVLTASRLMTRTAPLASAPAVARPAEAPVGPDGYPLHPPTDWTGPARTKG